MKKPLYLFPALALLLTTGCQAFNQGSNNLASRSAPGGVSLAQARRGFRTTLIRHERSGDPVPDPPPAVFRKVQFPSAVGSLAAYLTPDPKDGRKHPAIVWITGGDCNSIGDVWTPAPASNDQTASAFRKSGIVMMFPSLRGGNQNPGFREGFYGEVGDVLAAADYLARQPYVDPSRIYLGGHSTGGTLVLLVAECSDRFRAVFSFGPVGNVAAYRSSLPELLPFDLSNKREVDLRAPILWLGSVRSPVFVFEGMEEPSNLQQLELLERVCTNPEIHFLPQPGVDHFSILAPTTRLIAAKILRDSGPVSNLDFSSP